MAGETTVEVEDETVVEVDLGDGGEVQVEKKPEAAPAVAPTPAAATGADEAAAALTQSLSKAEEQRKAALATADAERRRADAATTALAAKDREAQEAQLSSLTSKIDAANRDMEAAKAALVSAHEEGDAVKMAEANASMARLGAAIDRLTAEKEGFEARINDPRRAAEGAPAISSFERWVTGSGFAPQAQAWLRAHPDCAPPDAGGDPVKNAAMMLGHQMAVKKGQAFNSDDYFATIESYVNGGPGVTEEPKPKPAPPPPATTQAKPAIPAAPPSREPPTSEGKPTGRQSVKLNSQQQEVALFSYPAKAGEDEMAHRKRAFATYAQELVAATREGKIGRLTH